MEESGSQNESGSEVHLCCFETLCCVEGRRRSCRFEIESRCSVLSLCLPSPVDFIVVANEARNPYRIRFHVAPFPDILIYQRLANYRLDCYYLARLLTDRLGRSIIDWRIHWTTIPFTN